jgi:UDP-N-acetylglucosamine 1-carboxyvinyltransferase
MIPKIDDAPWPGFPPDLTSIMTVVATQVEGTVLIHEKMFESRMFFVDKLIGMGARITLCDPHRAVVSGPSILRGEQLVSPDVRAGRKHHQQYLSSGTRVRKPHRTPKKFGRAHKKSYVK